MSSVTEAFCCRCLLLYVCYTCFLLHGYDTYVYCCVGMLQMHNAGLCRLQMFYCCMSVTNAYCCMSVTNAFCCMGMIQMLAVVWVCYRCMMYLLHVYCCMSVSVIDAYCCMFVTHAYCCMGMVQYACYLKCLLWYVSSRYLRLYVCYRCLLL